VPSAVVAFRAYARSLAFFCTRHSVGGTEPFVAKHCWSYGDRIHGTLLFGAGHAGVYPSGAQRQKSGEGRCRCRRCPQDLSRPARKTMARLSAIHRRRLPARVSGGCSLKLAPCMSLGELWECWRLTRALKLPVTTTYCTCSEAVSVFAGVIPPAPFRFTLLLDVETGGWFGHKTWCTMTIDMIAKLIKLDRQFRSPLSFSNYAAGKRVRKGPKFHGNCLFETQNQL
jgi:hypothetical protein